MSGAEGCAVVTKMNLTLSADHRVFEGKVAGIQYIFHWLYIGYIVLVRI